MIRVITLIMLALFVAGAPASLSAHATGASVVRIAIVTTRGAPEDPTFRTDVLRGLRRAASILNVRLALLNLEDPGQGRREPQFVAKQFADVPFEYFEVEAGSLDRLMDSLSWRFDVIIGAGRTITPALAAGAKRYPRVRFVSLDGTFIQGHTKASNFLQLFYREHEAAFLAGAIAALKSKGDAVSFIGAAPQYPYATHAIAFTAGAKYLRRSTRVLIDYTGWDPPVGRVVAKWEQIASAQFDLGADVVFISGASPPEGALRAALAHNRWVIGLGARTSQNLLPESLRRYLLTNVVKDYSVPIYDTIRAAAAGTYAGGYRVYGVRDGAIGYLADAYSREFLGGVVQRVERIKEIIEQDAFHIPTTQDELRKFLGTPSPP